MSLALPEDFTPDLFGNVHFEFSDIDLDWTGILCGSLWVTVLRSDRIDGCPLDWCGAKPVFIGYATPSQESRAKRLLQRLLALEVPPMSIQMNGTGGFEFHDLLNNKHFTLGAKNE